MPDENRIQPFQLPKGVKPKPGQTDSHFWDIDEETDKAWRKRVNNLYKKIEKEKEERKRN